GLSCVIFLFLRLLYPFGKYSDTVVNHLHNTTDNFKNIFPFSGTYDNLAAFQCRYDWCVVFEHFESTRRTGYGHGRDVAFKNGLVWGNDGKSHVNCGYTASANSFLPFSIASSMVPTKLKAASGYSSTSPSMIMLNPL